MDHLGKLYQEGRKFEKNKSTKDRKSKGVFYTPHEVVAYMVNNTIAPFNIVKNPYVKVLDLSCGAGYFLLKTFEVLKHEFEKHLEEIKVDHPELTDKLEHVGIGKFIVENNLWGADIDEKAVELTREALNKAAGCNCSSNVVVGDSLLQGRGIDCSDAFWRQGFDFVIGNPPYIGHKAVPKEHKTLLFQHYGKVYRDKSDISYCFFQRGMELLKPDGKLSFITSRYFLEGPSAALLREYLAEFDVQQIVDFGDSRVFSDAGVAVCIITIQKKAPQKNLCFSKIAEWDEKSGLSLETVPCHKIEKSALREDGWVFLEPQMLELFRLIEATSTFQLGEIVESHQGIITGCDKAFVLNQEEARLLAIEKELLKPWIKNSHVDKFCIKSSDKLLIYSDLIDDSACYPNAIAFAASYKEKLLQRRECQRGVRQWYQLQWGRDSKSFETAKLVYPYKASSNRFAVDRQGFYCSADVYSLILKSEFQDKLTLEYLAAMLNAKVTEFYFKCIAKKISPKFYDYYPNKVLKIKLKLDEINPNLEKLVILLYQTQNAAERKCILEAIDREIYKMYNLNEMQIKLIEKSAGE